MALPPDPVAGQTLPAATIAAILDAQRIDNAKATLLHTTGMPTSGVGNVGDIAIDDTAGVLYSKTSAGWIQVNLAATVPVGTGLGGTTTTTTTSAPTTTTGTTTTTGGTTTTTGGTTTTTSNPTTTGGTTTTIGTTSTGTTTTVGTTTSSGGTTTTTTGTTTTVGTTSSTGTTAFSKLGKRAADQLGRFGLNVFNMAAPPGSSDQQASNNYYGGRGDQSPTGITSLFNYLYGPYNTTGDSGYDRHARLYHGDSAADGRDLIADQITFGTTVRSAAGVKFTICPENGNLDTAGLIKIAKDSAAKADPYLEALEGCNEPNLNGVTYAQALALQTTLYNAVQHAIHPDGHAVRCGWDNLP
jgi:hypothetical protein